MNTFAQSRWDLGELFSGTVGEEIDVFIRDMQDCAASLETRRSLLTDEIDSGVFLDVLSNYARLVELTFRISAFAYLKFTEDTQNQATLDFQNRLDPILTDISNRTLFFGLWFKELPDQTVTRLIAASGEESPLGDVSYFLESLRRFKPYTLSEREEQIITLKDSSGVNTLLKLYEMITSRFKFKLEVDGEEKILTRDQLTANFRHPSPQIREATYLELNRVYRENALVLTEIYTSRVRDWHDEQLGLRNYGSALSVRNIANDVPDKAVDALLSVCRENNEIFHRYFKLKARWLGMDKLRRYDIYAPLAKSEKSYPFEQAVDLILRSFHSFSPKMAELAERMFVGKHLDSEIRSGKRGGAFCYFVLPEYAPWVSVNYSGKARDVATLAHELGHAVHAQMASAHNLLVCHAPLPLAETASVFAEMLLMDNLLTQESDLGVRRDILAHAVDDAWATIQRQAYFTLFERQAHQSISDGDGVDALNSAYMELLQEQFGDSVELYDEFKREWLLVPHLFNTPFYTYAYSFGQLLVYALYQRYKVQGEAFIPDYFKILSYGGSASPETVIREAGIDIASQSFWQGGFDVLKHMIDELEELG